MRYECDNVSTGKYYFIEEFDNHFSLPEGYPSRFYEVSLRIVVPSFVVQFVAVRTNYSRRDVNDTSRANSIAKEDL